MEITISSRDDVQVATVSGRIDSASAQDAQEQLSGAVTPGGKLVLDMTACDYLSSAGLRVLLWIAKAVARDGGAAVVAGLADDIRDVMEMTGFGSLFTNYATLDEAVAGIQEG